MIRRLFEKLKLIKPRQPHLPQTNVSGSVVLVSDILSEQQINRAILYYTKHKEYVDDMVKLTKNAFEPSQIEDKNDPMLWKAEYWKWFLTTDR
jgi:hypothetical protein